LGASNRMERRGAAEWSGWTTNGKLIDVSESALVLYFPFCHLPPLLAVIGMELDIEAWAEQNFGTCQWGDCGWIKRVVTLAGQVASLPDGSRPAQTERWGDCQAAYPLFDKEEVTFAGLCETHWQRTRARCGGICLLIGDTSDVPSPTAQHITANPARQPAAQARAPQGTRPTIHRPAYQRSHIRGARPYHAQCVPLDLESNHVQMNVPSRR
jgi:hypothetical protein